MGGSHHYSALWRKDTMSSYNTLHHELSQLFLGVVSFISSRSRYVHVTIAKTPFFFRRSASSRDGGPPKTVRDTMPLALFPGSQVSRVISRRIFAPRVGSNVPFP